MNIKEGLAPTTFHLQKTLESKRALRRNLTARTVGEKLRLLDAMRERELAIRGRAGRSDASALREGPVPYGVKKKQD